MRRVVSKLVWLGVFVVLSLLVVWRAQDITDVMMARGFVASAEMEELIAELDLTDRGLRIMNATRPQKGEGEWFNQNCTRHEVEMNVLGCFRAGRIFVFNVENEDLTGINTVTLAHEFLHAVYGRMSARERERIDRLVIEVFEEVRTEELDRRMEYYERTNLAAFYNELHSIIGTEVRDLPRELEEHYARFFRDRGRIVEIYEAYAGRLREVAARSRELVRELDELVDEINAKVAIYNAERRSLNGKIGEFNRRAREGDFEDAAAMNRERDVLYAEQRRLQGMLAEIEERTARHEEVARELREIALHIEALNRSIDSTAGGVPEV